MEHLFPPLLPKAPLQAPVVVLVAHPDDEIIACGAMLAWHRQQGHQVTVVHATDGAAGDPEQRFGDIVEVRRREGQEALARLGVTDLRRLGLTDGRLPEQRAELTQAVRGVLMQVQPKTLYSFFFTESHRDHRMIAHILPDCADVLAADCRVLLFGVNQPVSCGTMFDVTDTIEQKQHALSAFESQLAYNDFQQKIRHRDHSMTVNIEDNCVQYAEVFADLLPRQLAAARELGESLTKFLVGGEREARP